MDHGTAEEEEEEQVAAVRYAPHNLHPYLQNPESAFS